jgi:23S rRNA pseudouridine1911/1915/1917 synthase
MMSQFKLQWDIDEEKAGLLIRDFLKEKSVSKTALTDIKFNGGRIVVNGVEATVRYALKQGDLLEVYYPPEKQSEGIFEENIPLSILYEDPYVLVIDKPARMNTIPSREHPTGSVANALVGYYQSINLQSTAHIVTRLDRDTSGIVLIAKHRHVHHLFSKQQKSGGVHRTYEAFVHGVLPTEEGTITAPIGRKKDSIIEREVTDDGQYACTHYFVKQIYPLFTHTQLQLETGRTHQIRVHMKHIGHPLLGDDLYGGSRELIQRQALHCRGITFFHPIYQKELTFSSPLPEEMTKLFE